MSTPTLLRRLLWGLLFVGFASFLESLRLYSAYPYQVDAAVWTRVLPVYLILGALLGGACHFLLPFVTRKRDLEAMPGLHHGILVACSAITFAFLVQARIAWLDTSIPTASPFAVFTFSKVLAVGFLSYLLLYRVACAKKVRELYVRYPKGKLRFSFALLAIAVLSSWAAPIRNAALVHPDAKSIAQENSPNVLFLVLDTVAASHLGTYGYERDTSPFLDEIAANGVVFEKGFSAAPWTVPSHASMFTGLIPASHGTTWARPLLPDGRASVEDGVQYDLHTLSEELSLRGYDTAFSAEKSWLTFDSGMTQGFETVFDHSIPNLEERFWTMRIWDRYRSKVGMEKPVPIDKGGAGVVDSALDWLAGNHGRDTERPFFLFMNLNEAHQPYLPPQDYWGHFLPSSIPMERTRSIGNDTPSQRAITLGKEELSADDREVYIALYDEEILYQDSLIENLWRGMEKLALLENTLVVITSDHGEEFGELVHRMGHQVALTDRLLHVPMVLHFPKQLPQGRRVKGMASTIDLFPTILSIVEKNQGLTESPSSRELLAVQGVDQLPAILHENTSVRDSILAGYANPAPFFAQFRDWDRKDPMSFQLAHKMRTIDLLRTAEDKLFLYGDGKRAYVHIVEDPLELASETMAVPAEASFRVSEMEAEFWKQRSALETRFELYMGHLSRHFAQVP